ncbi:MAG: trypsin-like peptidase domain-containing protein [Gemmatimonadota bacterium]
MRANVHRLLLASLAVLTSAGCGGNGESGGMVDTLQAQVPPVAQQIDASRATAIVRAAERVSPAVVSVHVLRRQRVASAFFDPFFGGGRTQIVAGLGSGFIYDADGHILTNAHVVEGAERLRVTLPDGRDIEAELQGVDLTTDIAVLRTSEGGLPHAPMGTSEGLLIGEWAIAIGNPFGNLLSNSEPTVTAGVISALGRHIVPDAADAGFYLGMIQTDASINPGNSGGPLVNALGEVIGVNTSIFSRSGGSEGLGFAIPIDRAMRIARDLSDDGRVDRAWVGLRVQAAEADEWGRTSGVEIALVAGGSPAAQAGLLAGRRIVRANGRAMTGPLDYQAVLLDLRAGDEVTLEVEGMRDAVHLTATTLPSASAPRITALDGLELITVTSAIQAELGLASEEGALVTAVGGTTAARLGLTSGDVIRRVNQAVITTAEEASAALEDVVRRGGGLRLIYERGGRYITYDLRVR